MGRIVGRLAGVSIIASLLFLHMTVAMIELYGLTLYVNIINFFNDIIFSQDKLPLNFISSIHLLAKPRFWNTDSGHVWPICSDMFPPSLYSFIVFWPLPYKILKQKRTEMVDQV